MKKIEFYRGMMITINDNLITSIANKDENENIHTYNMHIQLTNNWRRNKGVYQFLDTFAIIGDEHK